MRFSARFLRLLLFVAAMPLAPAADASLAAVQRAQALLGDTVWSRVVRIENSARTGRYPRDFHALVFEFERLLWFYTPLDGTQSFSLHRGRLDAEKSDFVPLMRDIEPGFRRWHTVPPAADRPAPEFADLPLPNGCFVESVVAFRRLQACGTAMSRPRLLSYFGRSPAGRIAHTVLAYESGARSVVVDPDRTGRPDTYPLRGTSAPLALARVHHGYEIDSARELPIEAEAAVPAPSLVAVR